MTADPRIDGYDWSGGGETMLRFGPDTGPVVVAALPLFEEANRTRAFVVAILRALAVQGIGGVLPDLPGQGESLALLETVSLGDMQAAFAAATAYAGRNGRSTYAITVRSGALLPHLVLPRRRGPSLGPRLRGDAVAAGTAVGASWHLAPQDGPALLRELTRMQQANSADRSGGGASPTTFAGNVLSGAMLTELATAVPIGPARIVRLSTDPAPADRKIDGPPLWRRSEPGTDQALSRTLAGDIADWIAACEG